MLTRIVTQGMTPFREYRGLPSIFCSFGLYFMSFEGCTYIFFCIAEYWGTQNMYSSEHVFFDLYIYICTWMHIFW